MKKWFRFFFLSFFSHKLSKEGAKRSYTNVFLAFLLALVCIWAGFVGGDMLPFGFHYDGAPDFRATAYGVLANADTSKRIDAKIENGILKLKKYDGEYTEGLLINTFENDADKQNYSVNGYNVVVDSHPVGTLAEVEAYCVSNDGKNTIITYDEYLTLSDVAKLNFDFKLRYTGNALVLDEKAIESYRAYIDSLGNENKSTTEKLEKDLADNLITQSQYDRAIYELYFANYYPEITAYEATSKVPLLRNYYQHQYIGQGAKNYLFIFDDYITGSFETKNGLPVTFFGFYSDLENGALVMEGTTEAQANASVDNFIKASFEGIWILYAYSYGVNTITLVPFIALMLMVAALLIYSVLKLRGVDSIRSLGAMFKIVGSFVWFSGVISAVLSVIIAFFGQGSVMKALPLVLFFVALVIRSILFAMRESKLYTEQLLRAEATEQEEV